MKFLKLITVCLATVLFATTGTAIAKQEELPEVTEDGLHRVPDSKMAIVYAEPGADLAQSYDPGIHPVPGTHSPDRQRQSRLEVPATASARRR